MIKKISITAFIIVLLSATSYANTLDNLKKCVEIKDNSTRLICYDKMVKFEGKINTSGTTLSSHKSTVVVREDQKQNKIVQNKEEKFGREHLEKYKKDVIKQVVFTIKSAKKKCIQ